MPKTFFICPVRGHTQEETEAVVKQLEKAGWEVHWPPRDTDQDDEVGLEICKRNRAAIIESKCVHVTWDGKSQGGLFDLGMAFMADALLPFGVSVFIMSLPDPTEGKSFQNMIAAWASEHARPRPSIKPSVVDFLPNLNYAMKKRLEEDEKKHGDTWLKRPIEGQEDRIYQRFQEYYDDWKENGTPIPWLKIIGEAMIGWIRTTTPGLWGK